MRGQIANPWALSAAYVAAASACSVQLCKVFYCVLDLKWLHVKANDNYCHIVLPEFRGLVTRLSEGGLRGR